MNIDEVSEMNTCLSFLNSKLKPDCINDSINKQLINLNKTSNAGLGENRLAQQCFQNVYVIELLSQYGFTDLEDIKVVETVFKNFQ